MSLIDVEIEKLVYGGAGLTRVDGRTGLIPYTLPGEKLSAEITREGGRVFHAVPSVWRRESPERQSPGCPVFADCGGCHYQHIPYVKQLDFKESILRETLARLGKVEQIGEVKRIAGEPWGYRNRTQLRIAKRQGKAEIGFLAAGSHRLVDADYCPINSPKLNETHKALRRMAAERRFPPFLHEVEFFTNESEVQLNVVASEKPLAKRFFEWAAGEIEGLLPGEYLDYPSGGDLFRVGSRSFFQVNRFLTEALAREAVGGLGGGTALDLYSGVGLLTLPLARRFDHVIAVESSGAAIRSLQLNAQRAEVEVKAVHLNVEQFLEDVGEPIDFVAADPPRAGLGPKVTGELIRIRPARIALVSCDPSTLARDLRVLLDGGYAVEAVTMIDLFPQTFHLETIVRLRLE